MSEIPTLISPKTILDCALHYAFLGWRIIPDHSVRNGKCTCELKEKCKNTAKHPRINAWQNEASTEELDIRKWFVDFWPRSNIGLATGAKSNVFVVDIDVKKDGMKNWDALIAKHGDIPETPITKTGSGGHHIFFKWPKNLGVPTRSQLVPGVDIRGEGGQAVLPPSTNDNGTYEWCENATPWDVEIAEAPKWLLSMISAVSLEQQHDENRTRINVLKALSGVGEGQRNDALVRLAASLRAQDISYDTAMTWILQAADNCDPPYPHEEAAKKVQWAYRKFPSGTSWKNIQQPFGIRHSVDWETPVDFDEFDLPNFPLQVFPGWVKNYVEAVAESTQTPVDMAGLCAIAILATATARKVRVFVTNDWSEPLNIYTVVCAEPGSRKSAVFRHMTEPIKEFESHQKSMAELDVNKMKTEIDFLEAKYKHLRSRVGKVEKEEQLNLQIQAEEIRNKINDLSRKAILPDILADDITPQEIKRKLFEQRGRLAILSAEGDIFSMMNGRYQANGEPDVDVYLKGHPGDDIKVNRVSGRAEEIGRPALTIGVCTQKKSLRGLLTKTGVSNRGLYARFLYCICEKLPNEKTNAAPIPFRVSDTYRKNISTLMRINYRDDIGTENPEAPHILTLSTDARRVLDEFRVWVNQQGNNGGVLKTDELKEWGAKLAGAIVRIAGILHIAELVTEDSPWDFEINSETMEKSRLLGSYLISHAIAAHEQMESSISYDIARDILKYIEETNKTTLTKQDAVRCTKKHGQVIENALSYLIDRGFIRDLNEGKSRGQHYEVNPKWNHNIPGEPQCQ